MRDLASCLTLTSHLVLTLEERCEGTSYVSSWRLYFFSRLLLWEDSSPHRWIRIFSPDFVGVR
jgi:hypothetical protein